MALSFVCYYFANWHILEYIAINCLKLGVFEFVEASNLSYDCLFLGPFENTSCLLLAVKKLKHFQTPFYVMVLLFLIQYLKDEEARLKIISKAFLSLFAKAKQRKPRSKQVFASWKLKDPSFM